MTDREFADFVGITLEQLGTRNPARAENWKRHPEAESRHRMTEKPLRPQFMPMRMTHQEAKERREISEDEMREAKGGMVAATLAVFSVLVILVVVITYATHYALTQLFPN